MSLLTGIAHCCRYWIIVNRSNLRCQQIYYTQLLYVNFLLNLGNCIYNFPLNFTKWRKIRRKRKQCLFIFNETIYVSRCLELEYNSNSMKQILLYSLVETKLCSQSFGKDWLLVFLNIHSWTQFFVHTFQPFLAVPELLQSYNYYRMLLLGVKFGKLLVHCRGKNSYKRKTISFFQNIEYVCL